MKHEVALLLDDKKYTGWDSVSIKKSIETICGSFSIGVLNDSITKNIYPGIPCKIKIDDAEIITGYLDKRDRKNDENGRVITFSGRDKTGDLVDCSLIKKSGSWKNVSLVKLCEDVCKPFGIKVSYDSKVKSRVLEKFLSASVQDGETVFTFIERLCRTRSVLPLSDEKGNVFLTETSSDFAIDKIIVGENAIDLSESIDYSDRFSDYIVKSQKSANGSKWTKDNTRVNGSATDEILKDLLGRYRPYKIEAESQSSYSLAKRRAAWEAVVRFSKSMSMSVTLSDWTQKSGLLWSRNTLVDVIDEKMDIENTMLISDIEYKISENDGFKAVASLRHKNSYIPEPKAVQNKKKSKNPFA